MTDRIPDKRGPTARTPRCPICGEPAEAATRPFCSRRCRDIDLGRWLTGGYLIAGGNTDANEDGDERTPPSGGTSGPDREPSER